jgi:hypothetical protein
MSLAVCWTRKEMKRETRLGPKLFLDKHKRIIKQVSPLIQ